jgi:hypothetical protein
MTVWCIRSESVILIKTTDSLRTHSDENMSRPTITAQL